MLRFRKFIIEDSELKLKLDNPGGDWLRRQQKNAEEKMANGPGESASSRGITGSTTGYFNKYPKLPTHVLKHVVGAMGEENFRDHSSKLERLEKTIGHPSKFNSKEHPILIGVNHKGHPHIIEGNHRVAYANKHGISHVHSEVKYFNGGEAVKGNFHPDKVMKIAK